MFFESRSSYAARAHCAALFGLARRVRYPVPSWLVQSKSRWLLEWSWMKGVYLYTLPSASPPLVERQHVWELLIFMESYMDGVTRAIVTGKRAQSAHVLAHLPVLSP